MNVNTLRYFKIPVQKKIKITIISNNPGKLVNSGLATKQNEQKLVALIDDELWLLPNHKDLREVFARYGAGTVISVYRKNRGHGKYKLKVNYDFNMVYEVSNKKASRVIKKHGHDKTLSMIINGQFYKEIHGKDYKEPAVMSFF